MRHPAARVALGLSLALVLLLLVELVLRSIVGAPEAPVPFVRARWNMDGPAFQDRGELVVPGYQQQDMVGPFPREPRPGVPRVLVFGGSSIRAGSRIPPQHEAPARLQDLLLAAGQPAEVINLGRPALDSHHHLEVLREAVAFQPDLVVLYMGHNDLGNAALEDRYGTVGASLGLRARLLLGRLASYTLLEKLLRPQPGHSGGAYADPAVEAQRIGAQAGTKRDCPPDDPRRELAARDLEDNLVAMATLAAEVGAGAVMVTPVSDWVSAGPVGSSCPELLDEGGKSDHPPRPGEPRLSPKALTAALERDPDCPELLFERGMARLKRGDDGAYEDLRAAMEGDPLPLRATRAMTDAVRAAAERSGARLVDLEAQAERDHGAPPPAWFTDVVHLSAKGHVVLAEALLPVVQEELAPNARTSPPR